MPVKGLLKLSFFAAALSIGTAAVAQEKPRSMLGDFDLKSVILSPQPLGPPSQFEPKAAAKPDPDLAAKPEPTAPNIAAKPEARRTVAEKPAPKRTTAKPDVSPPRKMTSSKPRQKSAVAARKPKASPLESFARDSGRQTWPCVGGGICNWAQPR